MQGADQNARPPVQPLLRRGFCLPAFFRFTARPAALQAAYTPPAGQRPNFYKSVQQGSISPVCAIFPSGRDQPSAAGEMPHAAAQRSGNVDKHTNRPADRSVGRFVCIRAGDYAFRYSYSRYSFFEKLPAYIFLKMNPCTPPIASMQRCGVISCSPTKAKSFC